MHEIERKYLLRKPAEEVTRHCRSIKRIEQRYLGGETGDWSIRIRQSTCEGKTTFYMTLKRRVSDMTCIEVESEIAQAFYADMAKQAGPPLRKTRHEVLVGEHIWEVDVFDDIDLCLAEIELSHEDETFVLPSWAGKEVTGKKRYSNRSLARLLR